MEHCLFCRIIERKVPAKIVHEDERAVAIEDIHPQAPVHLLVLPRQHVTSLKEARPKTRRCWVTFFWWRRKWRAGGGWKQRAIAP